MIKTVLGTILFSVMLMPSTIPFPKNSDVTTEVTSLHSYVVGVKDGLNMGVCLINGIDIPYSCDPKHLDPMGCHKALTAGACKTNLGGR